MLNSVPFTNSIDVATPSSSEYMVDTCSIEMCGTQHTVDFGDGVRYVYVFSFGVTDSALQL
jgi:hypothetical protein